MTQIAERFNLMPEVEEFLAEDPIKPFINGKYVDHRTGATINVVDPGSGIPIARVAACGSGEIDDAVRAAEKAFAESGWPTLPPNERAVLLHRLADLVEKKIMVLAQLEALDCGKLQRAAINDIGNLCSTLRYYTDLSIHTARRSAIAVSGHEAWAMRHPYGVCAFVLPWNFPFLLLGWGISPALAAGNTVVVKPAEDTPLSTLYFGKLVQEAGIPDGVINLIPGLGPEAGASLARHPRIKRMGFTGSPEVGKFIAGACAENLVPAKLELGGKGAAVVFGDVDVEDTASKLVDAITFHTGQVCCTASRWIVQKPVYEKFLSSCAESFDKLRIGHELKHKTSLGPVVSSKQKDRVLSFMTRGQEEGAELLYGGGPATVAGCEGGYYIKPTMLAGGPDNIAAQKEIFGPVAYVMSFETEEEGVRLANSTDYGLANSVWTGDAARASRVAEAMIAGNSWINAHNVFVHGVPYGGVNLSGLGGGVLGPETYFDYLRPQSIVRPL